MSLPTGTEIATLSFVCDGLPFAPFQASTADTLTLSFVANGMPMYAQGASGGGGGPPVATRPSFFLST